MLTASTQLLEKLDAGETLAGIKDVKHFDIKDYHETIKATTRLVEASNRLVSTGELEKMIRQLINAMDRAEKEGEELVDHAFRQGIILILIWLIGYVIAKLAYDTISRKQEASKSDAV